MGDTVFVIERGEYSDYRVVGVYATREAAEAIAAKLNGAREYGDEATIAEWPLNPGVNALNHGLTFFKITMLRDGAVEYIDAKDGWADEEVADVAAWIWRRSKAPAYRGQRVSDAMRAGVWAKDEQHAIKIANEKRAQLIASGEWEATP